MAAAVRLAATVPMIVSRHDAAGPGVVDEDLVDLLLPAGVLAGGRPMTFG